MSAATSSPRVVVLAGGLSFERDVSLRSGRRVSDALRSAGVEADVCDADAGLLAHLAATTPDAVLIALHGGAGEDGAVRAVLDAAGIRYVGSAPSACRMAWDKPTAKALVAAAGVATPPWVALPHATFRELGAGPVLGHVLASLGLPVMVKPAQGGSALGATVVRDESALPAAMVGCFAYGETALVESFVEGVEVAVTVVEQTAGEPVALPAVEIRPKEGVYDYAARYTAGATEFVVPAQLDPDVLAACAAAAVTAHRALGLRDLSRSDLIVAPDGTTWFLEANTSPGMTETSLVPMAVEAAGLELGALLRQLVERAAARA